tara:strand:- start:2675 stop:3265 length:591 start_codon:yes stop_codon:yes gene_type:complete
LLLHGLRLGSIKTIRSADQDEIGGLKLIPEQVIDGCEVIQIGILLTLTLEGRRISDGTAGTECLPIHNGDHTIYMHPFTDGWPFKSLQQRPGQSEAAGLNDDAIQLLGTLEQCLHRREEIVLHRAAQTAVVELHQPGIDLVVGAETTAADQITVETDRAEFIDHHGQTLAAVDQEMTKKCGLTGTKEPGDDSDRKP